MPINIHAIFGDFNEAAYQFLRTREGFVPRVYSDSNGIPTLGIGYALAVKGNSGIFAIRSTLVSDLALIGVTLTAADSQRLTDVIDAVNFGNTAQAKTLIPVFKHGEYSSQVNKFSFMLSGPTQFRPLFDIALDEATIILRSKLGVPLFSSLAGSNEMVALLSLTFNNPELIGDNLLNALQTGQRVEAWYEIRYRSNAGQDQGIANRRYAESDLFGLYDGANGQFPESEQEARQVLGFLRQPNIEKKITDDDVKYQLNASGVISGSGVDRYLQPAESLLKALFYSAAAHVFVGPGGDPVQGTDENDLLLGNSGHDILIGGGGNDVLRGEAGQDVYIYNSGDGEDTILDTDGQGLVVFDHHLLQGGLKKQSEGVYTSLDGEIRYQRDGDDLVEVRL